MELTEKMRSAKIPDFSPLDHHLKLVQVGELKLISNKLQLLAEQGVVFTDFHSALEKKFQS